MTMTIVRYGFLNENFRSSLCGECACDKFAEHRRQVNHDDGVMVIVVMIVVMLVIVMIVVIVVMVIVHL